MAPGITEAKDARVQSVSVDQKTDQVSVRVQAPTALSALSPEEISCMIYLYEGDLARLPELPVWKRATLDGLDLKAPITPVMSFRFDQVKKTGRYCLMTVFRTKKNQWFRTPGVVFWLPVK